METILDKIKKKRINSTIPNIIFYKDIYTPLRLLNSKPNPQIALKKTIYQKRIEEERRQKERVLRQKESERVEYIKQYYSPILSQFVRSHLNFRELNKNEINDVIFISLFYIQLKRFMKIGNKELNLLNSLYNHSLAYIKEHYNTIDHSVCSDEEYRVIFDNLLYNIENGKNIRKFLKYSRKVNLYDFCKRIKIYFELLTKTPKKERKSFEKVLREIKAIYDKSYRKNSIFKTKRKIKSTPQKIQKKFASFKHNYIENITFHHLSSHNKILFFYQGTRNLFFLLILSFYYSFLSYYVKKINQYLEKFKTFFHNKILNINLYFQFFKWYIKEAYKRFLEEFNFFIKIKFSKKFRPFSSNKNIIFFFKKTRKNDALSNKILNISLYFQFFKWYVKEIYKRFLERFNYFIRKRCSKKPKSFSSNQNIIFFLKKERKENTLSLLLYSIVDFFFIQKIERINQHMKDFNFKVFKIDSKNFLKRIYFTIIELKDNIKSSLKTKCLTIRDTCKKKKAKIISIFKGSKSNTTAYNIISILFPLVASLFIFFVLIFSAISVLSAIPFKSEQIDLTKQISTLLSLNMEYRFLWFSIEFLYFSICLYLYRNNKRLSNKCIKFLYISSIIEFSLGLFFLFLGILWALSIFTTIFLCANFIYLKNQKGNKVKDKNLLLTSVILLITSSVICISFYFSQLGQIGNNSRAILIMFIAVVILNLYLIERISSIKKFKIMSIILIAFDIILGNILYFLVQVQDYFSFIAIFLITIIITETLYRKRNFISNYLYFIFPHKYHIKKTNYLLITSFSLCLGAIVIFFIFPVYTIIFLLLLLIPGVIFTKKCHIRAKRKSKSIRERLQGRLDGKLQAYAYLILIFLMIVPWLASIPFTVNIDQPKIEFARYGSENYDDLEYGYLSELEPLSINDRLIARTETDLALSQSSQLLFTLTPQNISNKAGRELQFSYNLKSGIVNGPKEEIKLYNDLFFDNYNLLPGDYELKGYLKKYQWFSWHSSQVVTYQITLERDQLSVRPSEFYNRNGLDAGAIITFENEDSSWTVMWNCTIVDSRGKGVQLDGIKLYLEVNNRYKLINTVSTDKYGHLAYIHKVYGYFETNALSKIAYDGDDLYKRLLHEEYAGLSGVSEEERFFIDHNGDLIPDEWTFTFSQLLKSFRTIPDISHTYIDNLIFKAEFLESYGQQTYDSINEYEGLLAGDTFWTIGKHGGGVEFDGESDYIDFGEILDSELYNSSEFTILSWIYPTNLSSDAVSNNGIKNVFLSKRNMFELGISETGYVQAFLNTTDIAATAQYGDIGSIKENEWQLVILRFNNSDVDVYIKDMWYYAAEGGMAEPWLVANNTITSGGALIFGGELTSNSYYAGKMDEIAIFNTALMNLEIDDYIGLELLVNSSVLKDVDGSWAAIINNEIVDGYINFQSYNLGKEITSLEFYLSESYPELENPDIASWHLINSYYEDRDYYSYVIDSRTLPDGNYYFIVRGVDKVQNEVYSFFNKPFSINHFNTSIQFNYINHEDRINQNSFIGVAPRDTFE